jgi:hypothetical protein
MQFDLKTGLQGLGLLVILWLLVGVLMKWVTDHPKLTAWLVSQASPPRLVSVVLSQRRGTCAAMSRVHYFC